MELNNLFKFKDSNSNIFAILDTAISPEILPELLAKNIPHTSLFEGDMGDLLQDVAPYLIQCHQESEFTMWLVSKGWGKHWCIFFVSQSSIVELKQHFRQFLIVNDEDEKQYYFRFYDPRVLRVFLSTCTIDEAIQFFGPIKQFLVEDEEPDKLLTFTISPNGVECQKEKIPT
ncbi:MAG: DUF4123 domain-containing protein [Candidatus Desantisbacteria bacterium]